jgi:hypothetical protein
MNNKSACEIFSSIEVKSKRHIEKIEASLQPIIILCMAACGLAFGAMDVKEYTKKLIRSM